MFEKLDKYLLAFDTEEYAVDYWYDEGVIIAENMLQEFCTNDWKSLVQIIPKRTTEWKKHLAYCMHDGNDMNQLMVLLTLINTEDIELLEIVVDSLRGFSSEESLSLIQNNIQVLSKIKELMPKVGVVTKRVFEEFLIRK